MADAERRVVDMGLQRIRSLFGDRGRARTPLATVVTGYLAALTSVAIMTLVSMAGAAIFEAAVFAMVFPLTVSLVTARFGVGPAVVTAIGGAAAFDYVFVSPALAFAVPNLKDGLTLVVMLVVAALASVLAEQSRRRAEGVRRQAEVERLRNALLASLSHDLRSPIAALIAAGAALSGDCLEPRERTMFLQIISDEAGRLGRLVATLLDLTRLESRALRAKRTPEAIEEVIGSALCRLARPLEGHTVVTHVPEAIPLSILDPVLIEQVIINLVENVLHHAASPIEIAARQEGRNILVEVADRGPGVRPGDEDRVFQKFYRGRAEDAASAGESERRGLGLTICRAIVTAHGGRIWLENRAGGGTVVRFTLPALPASRLHSVGAAA
jgi:two-component system sensor histidine kinase KdpD